jgi:hypothetical protein
LQGITIEVAPQSTECFYEDIKKHREIAVDVFTLMGTTPQIQLKVP